jgi:hypothetical protein
LVCAGIFHDDDDNDFKTKVGSPYGIEDRLLFKLLNGNSYSKFRPRCRIFLLISDISN